MLRHLPSIAALLLALGLGACADEATKMCNDASASIKFRVSACGERCEKQDGEACAKQDELAQQACFKDKNAEICEWMCNYATTGKDLYCKEHEALKAAAPK
ncbi:MAG TPA: hypothetical protein PKW35_08775 [Nannocystaceae bacterium]|nr:hypothetical protein [Nannocystaceae bacterium]